MLSRCTAKIAAKQNGRTAGTSSLGMTPVDESKFSASSDGGTPKSREFLFMKLSTPQSKGKSPTT